MNPMKKLFAQTARRARFAVRPRRLAALLAAALLTVSLAGCGAGASSSAPASVSAASSAAAQSASAGGGTLTVGLLQLVTHPSLDEIRTAITKELESGAAAKGLTLKIDYKNAENDLSAIDSICRGFVAEKADVIVAIATPAAQGAAKAAAGTGIPVIFSAVTDPVAAGLVSDESAPDLGATGTSDAIPVGEIFDLAGKLTPDAKKFGLLYSTGEVNSQTVIAQARQLLDSRGVAYEEKGIASLSDLQTAVTALAGEVDAVFIPIDNTIASAMSTVADICTRAGVPVYVSADSMVADGGLATVGVNYTNLGTQTADMALAALTGTPVSALPVETLKEYSVAVNKDTAAALGVDVSAYAK